MITPFILLVTNLTSLFITYHFRRRRSLSRERAASIGIKNKGIETISGSESNASKLDRSSLQNVEFQPATEMSCVSEDSVNTLNGGILNVRKRNSTDGSNRESYVIGNIRDDSVMKSIDGRQRRSQDSGHNIDGPSDRADSPSVRRVPSNLETSHTEDPDKFSYVNLVFDNNNDVTSSLNDGVVLRATAGSGLPESTSQKPDV